MHPSQLFPPTLIPQPRAYRGLQNRDQPGLPGGTAWCGFLLAITGLKGLYELGHSISQNTRGRRKWLLKVTALSVGGLHLHPELLTPGPTTSRGQERLPGGRDRIQGRGVGQAVGARRATKGIPGSQGLGHGQNGQAGSGTWELPRSGPACPTSSEPGAGLAFHPDTQPRLSTGLLPSSQPNFWLSVAGPP